MSPSTTEPERQGLGLPPPEPLARRHRDDRDRCGAGLDADVRWFDLERQAVVDIDPAELGSDGGVAVVVDRQFVHTLGAPGGRLRVQPPPR